MITRTRDESHPPNWHSNAILDHETYIAGGESTTARSQLQIEGMESVYTVAEVAKALRWSYDSVRRYFKDLPGVLVKYQPRRYRRAYRTYMIPRSVFQREWQKMANVNARGVK